MRFYERAEKSHLVCEFSIWYQDAILILRHGSFDNFGIWPTWKIFRNRPEFRSIYSPRTNSPNLFFEIPKIQCVGIPLYCNDYTILF